MGTYYKGSATYFHEIIENLSVVKIKYKYDNGYFGTKGESSSAKVRNIKVDNPKEKAKEFYDEITYGGIEQDIYNKKTGEKVGKKTHLADGTVITWRNVSSSDGSPAVDINISYSSYAGDLKSQKIHFIK